MKNALVSEGIFASTYSRVTEFRNSLHQRAFVRNRFPHGWAPVPAHFQQLIVRPKRRLGKRPIK
jgi:hypothetical protein